MAGSISDVSERRHVEELLKDAIENLGEGFSLWDSEDRLVLHNEKYLQSMSGITDILKPGLKFEDMIRALAERELRMDALGREKEWIQERMKWHRDPGAPFELQFTDGTWIAVQEFRTSDGGTVTVRTDITERKRMERQAAERVKRLQKVSEISMTLTGEPAEVFDLVVSMIGELLNVHSVCLSEIRGEELNFLSVWTDGKVKRNAGHCPLAITPCATVEKAKKLLCYDRVAEKFPDASFLKAQDAVSYCGFPSLDSNGNVVAITCLLDNKPHDFSEEDIHLLRILGQRIGVEMERQSHLIERRRAEEEITARAHQQAAVAELGQQALGNTCISIVMNTAVERVARTLGAEYCKVLELLPDKDELLLRAGVGWKQGLVGNATVSADKGSQAGFTLLSSEPVIVEDLRTERRFDGPPLLHDHDVISGMSVIIGDNDQPYGVLGVHTTSPVPSPRMMSFSYGRLPTCWPRPFPASTPRRRRKRAGGCCKA